MASTIRGSDNFDTSIFSQKLHGSTGYQKLPGGFIIQWGTAPQDVATITFPIAFPTACLNVNLSLKDVTYTGSASAQYSSTKNWTTTSFDLTVASTSIGGTRPWIAIGY